MDWVDLICPIPCNTFWLEEDGGLAFVLSSDNTNLNAQKTVKAGTTFGVLHPPSTPGQIFPGEDQTLLQQYGTRFLPGQRIGYVKSTDANPVNVVVYFAA